MVTAAELFATTGSEEPHIIIGRDRVIKVPDSLKRIAVESDHDIETVTFECPRYWDEHDLSKMAIYINYMLSNKYADSYPVSKITTDDNTMFFTWTISRNVTQVSGGITFLVCIKNTDSEGNEVNHWNSELCKDMYVSKGMETEPQIVEEQTDLVTELLLRMSTVEQINVQAEEMQQILTEARDAKGYCDDTLLELESASEGFFNNYANAIKGNVSGDLICVDDVSPMEHTVKCWVHGKNLFNGEVIAGIFSNATFYTYTQDAYISIKVYLKKGTYTLSISDTVYMARTILDGMYQIVGVTLSPGNQYTFTVNNDGYVGFSMRRNPSAEWDNATNIQIEEGIIATEYIEYIDPSTVTVLQYRDKNLFPEKALDSTNWVKDNAENSGYKHYYLSLPPGTYTVSAKCDVGLNDYGYFYIQKSSDEFVNVITIHYSMATTVANRITFTLNEGEKCRLLWYHTNKNFNDIFRDVLIERGSIATTFEQYSCKYHTPESDGTLSIDSISPIMSVTTDTIDMIVNIEYNRDTTKMFESYVLTDDAKSEIATLIENDMADVLAALNSYATSVIGGGS